MTKESQKTHKDFPINYSADWAKPAIWLVWWVAVGIYLAQTGAGAVEIEILLLFVFIGSVKYIRNFIARITGVLLPEFLIITPPFLIENEKEICKKYQLLRIPDIGEIAFYIVPRKTWKWING